MAIKKPLRVSVFRIRLPLSLSLAPSVPCEALRRIEIASRNAIEIGTGHGTRRHGMREGAMTVYLGIPGQVKAQSKRFARGGCVGNMQN